MYWRILIDEDNRDRRCLFDLAKAHRFYVKDLPGDKKAVCVEFRHDVTITEARFPHDFDTEANAYEFLDHLELMMNRRMPIMSSSAMDAYQSRVKEGRE